MIPTSFIMVSMMAKITLTQQFVKTATCPSGRRKVEYYDTSLKSFGVEIRHSGGKTYFTRFRNQKGNDRQFKLGDANILTLAQAKLLASKVQAKVCMGEDPSAEKKECRSVPTFAQFIEQDYLPHIDSYKKSANSDRSYLRNQILPVFGSKFMDEITRKDISDFHRDLIKRGYRPGTANRALVLLRFAFNLGLKWEVPGLKGNPTQGVALHKDLEGKKERFLSEEETIKLFDSLQQSDNKMLPFIVATLLLAGVRKREALDARWEDVDLNNRLWHIPKTKAGRPRYVPISDSLCALFRSIPHYDNCDWVFPNHKTMRPYESVFNSWNSARKLAGLEDVRLHDLRHSFASFAINSGRSIYEIKALLGHQQLRTTERYSHLAKSTLMSAVDAVGNLIGPAITKSTGININQLGYRGI